MPMRKRLLQMLAALGAAVLLLLGVVVAGRATREWLRQQDRAAIAFAAIDCEPPPRMPRAEFLDEVQYLASFPDQIRLLDDDLAERLADAFARHPWVEKVERVEIVPLQQVRVRLTYRTPVLAVPYSGQLRAVDRNGVLLPANAATDGLPIFPGTPGSPSGPAGTRWGDTAVEEAAARAAG
jgi:hypothetical protein